MGKNRERISELEDRLESIEDRCSEVAEELGDRFHTLEENLCELETKTNHSFHTVNDKFTDITRRLDAIEPLINKTETEKLAINIAKAIDPIIGRIEHVCRQARDWVEEKAYNDMADALEQLNTARSELSKAYATKQSIK